MAYGSVYAFMTAAGPQNAIYFNATQAECFGLIRHPGQPPASLQVAPCVLGAIKQVSQTKANPAPSASDSAAPASLQNIASLTGNCERLVVSGHDLSAGCEGKILQSIYDNGRTGFYLLFGKDGVATFSGFDGPNPDKNSQIETLDLLIYKPDGVANPSKTAVSGTCLYSNPYLGPTSISCNATDSAGAVSALELRTDGKPPTFSSPATQ